MRVTLTGATGLIGSRIVAALKARGDEVTVLSRDPDRARDRLGVEAARWDPESEGAPPAALAGRDGVVHLAGENVGQRWTTAAKERILASRERGTRNLVQGILDAEPPPAVLVCASGANFYGPRGDEPVDETHPPGSDWLAGVCVRWESQADAAKKPGTRVVKVRTGVVLDAEGGALARMLPPFKAGIAGPIGGGRQYMPWIHLDDLVGLYLAALDTPSFAGPINASAPTPVTNKEFSRALGQALHRPAVAPIPAFTIKLMYGEMAQIVLDGVRMVPARAAELGYEFAYTDLDEALRDTLKDG